MRDVRAAGRERVPAGVPHLVVRILEVQLDGEGRQAAGGEQELRDDDVGGGGDGPDALFVQLTDKPTSVQSHAVAGGEDEGHGGLIVAAHRRGNRSGGLRSIGVEPVCAAC